jgi:hypothetical protein
MMLRTIWRIITSKEFRAAVRDTIDIIDNPSGSLEETLVRIEQVWRHFFENLPS